MLVKTGVCGRPGESAACVRRWCRGVWARPGDGACAAAGLRRRRQRRPDAPFCSL